jgi:hypothetical protein
MCPVIEMAAFAKLMPHICAQIRMVLAREEGSHCLHGFDRKPLSILLTLIGCTAFGKNAKKANTDDDA